MERITKEIKAIADSHIEARKKKTFDNPLVGSSNDVFAMLMAGKTIEPLLYEIELRYCSITSTVMSSQMGYSSEAYRKGVYKGFKELFLNKQR